VTDGKAGWGDKFGSDIDHINREGVGLFIEGKGCRRLVLGRFFDRAEAEVSSYREMQAEYCDRYLKKGANRVGNREGIGGCNREDIREEEDKEEEEEGEEDDNDDEAERVPAATVVNRLKENIQEESRRIIKLYSWLD
jgi:hypothetical protein